MVGRLVCPRNPMSYAGWTSHGSGRVSHARLVTEVEARQSASTWPSKELGVEHMANWPSKALGVEYMANDHVL